MLCFYADEYTRSALLTSGMKARNDVCRQDDKRQITVWRLLGEFGYVSKVRLRSSNSKNPSYIMLDFHLLSRASVTFRA